MDSRQDSHDIGAITSQIKWICLHRSI